MKGLLTLALKNAPQSLPYIDDTLTFSVPSMITWLTSGHFFNVTEMRIYNYERTSVALRTRKENFLATPYLIKDNVLSSQTCQEYRDMVAL